MFNLYTQARGATINPTIHKILLQSPTSPSKSLNHRSKSMAPCCVETVIRENNHNPDRHTGNNLHLNPNSRNYKDFSSCPQSVRQNSSIAPVCPNGSKPLEIPVFHDSFAADDDIWSQMINEAQIDVKQEPILSSYYTNSILCHNSLESALAYNLSSKLGSPNLPSTSLVDLFLGVLIQDQDIIEAVEEDLRAVKERDPACISYVHCFLNFKGFSACQAHRIAHSLWTEGRKIMALLIQNRVSEVFAVDIHPGAKIGRGILLDHATGLVIGETAVIGNNVSILHNVTLGSNQPTLIVRVTLSSISTFVIATASPRFPPTSKNPTSLPIVWAFLFLNPTRRFLKRRLQKRGNSNSRNLPAMEPSSVVPDSNAPSTGAASHLLANLPSRGFMSSAVPSSNLGGMRVYLCDRDTSPPEHQVIKTDQMNILIRALTLKKKGETKAAPSAMISRKRTSERTNDGRASTKKAMTNAESSGQREGSSSGTSGNIEYQRMTVDRLRTILREKGLSPKGKKDELIARLRSAGK